jgi:hypothetical protein
MSEEISQITQFQDTKFMEILAVHKNFIFS